MPRTALLASLTLAASLTACDDEPAGGGGSAADAAAAADAAVAADARPPVDAGAPDASLKLQCTCAAGPENCDACLRLISKCCNEGEETFGGRLPYLVATCQGDPNCAACCDECAARTCEQVVRAGDCPLQP